jgi:membrane peptidoglycan carboxypeptidase
MAAAPSHRNVPYAIRLDVLYPVAVKWMRTRDHSLIANAASLLICGVLAGIVVAAAAFPAIAMGGLAAKAGADTFGELPRELVVKPSPQITYVYASDNKTLLATIYDENRHDVKLADIPLVMRNAIIAAEDERFYDHNGVDLQGILRAFVANQQSDSTQGASTLTMQYVRQAITYSATSPAQVIAATEQTNGRKLREARLAVSLETVMTKDEILERYLNIAAFGHTAYGIYAASQVYFNKEPKDLKLEEAALLAGLPKAPSAYDPVTEEGRPKALARRAYVLDQMYGLNMITKAELEAAKQSELKVTGKRTPNGCVSTPQNQWGFFCDYLYRWWLEQDVFGQEASDREARLKAGGYRIVSTLDVGIQNAARKHIDSQLKTTSSDALMVAAIEPGTGRIRAMAVNRVYGLDTSKNGRSSDPAKRRLGIKGTYPTTTNPLLSGGGDITGYKGGSTYKLFTMLAALEKGYPLDFQIVARSPYRSKYVVGRTDPAVCPDKIYWCPGNANPEYMNGPRTMWSGFGRSVNTYFVPLEEKVGADKAVEMARRLGVQFRAKGTEDAPADFEFSQPGRSAGWGPFTIGVSDAVPLETLNAYATIAADGKYCKPIPVVDIYEANGTKLANVSEPQCKQAVKPEVARAAIDAARCPVYDQGFFGGCDGGTARDIDGKTVREVVGRPLAGKTGTSDDNWTANLFITTKQLAVGGTLANPDYAQTEHDGTAARKVNTAVSRTLRDALKGLPRVNFTAPPRNLALGVRVRVPDVKCMSVRAATSALRTRGFDVSVDPRRVNSECGAGEVAGTDPTGTTSRGSTVVLLISNSINTNPSPTPGPGGGGGGGPGGGGPGGGGPGGGNGLRPAFGFALLL